MYLVDDFIDALQEVGLTTEGDQGARRVNILKINHTLQFTSEGRWRHYPNNTIGHEIIGKMYSDWHDFDELKPYFARFNAKESVIANFDKLYRLIKESSLPEYDDSEKRKNKLHKYKEIAKAHFGIDLIGYMVHNGFDNKEDGGEWVFYTDTIMVALTFDITGGKSLSHVRAKDRISKARVSWSRVDTFNNNHSPKQIFNFIFHGSRPGEHQSFAENKEVK